MPQRFPRSANALFRLAFYGAVPALLGIGAAAYGFYASPWQTREGEPRDQPVPFSHRHHAGQLGLDCRYCHPGVETSAFAGLPPTSTCMTCHAKLYVTSPVLSAVRESLASGQPIPWNRVDLLPDYVYFDHSVHVHAGVGCAECHGRVDRMALTATARAWTMQACLDCHRAPEQHLRPREAVFDLAWTPPPHREVLGRRLVATYHVLPTRQLQNCSTCHR